MSQSYKSETLSESWSNFSDELPAYSMPKRPKLNIIDDNVLLALDRTKTSSRSATHILAAAATSLGHDLNDVNLSHSTIHRHRIITRTKMTAQLKADLMIADHLIVHWDGKLLPQLGSQQKVDRLPIVVSGLNSEQLLGVPKICDGTAENHAIAIAETINAWGLGSRVKAMSFDTAAVNTGKTKYNSKNVTS